MNYAGKFGSGTPDSFSSADLKIDSLAHHAGGDTVTIPDAHLLFSGDYSRSGNDLIVSDHLHRVVVPNYFHGAKHPTLVSPDGAPLDASVIDALTGHVQYAQAANSAAAAAAKVVGHVVKMTGSASVVRNGVTITLNNGDTVLQNDVVQTGSGSTLGLVMIDGTTFNLSAGARLMLNDLTYDASSTSNSSLFTLVQGAASFVAGQVAKTGDMKVGTPVATMGIRGTAVILDVSAIDGKVSISVVDQRDGQLHSVQVYNTRGILIGTVTSNGTGLTLTPAANFEVIAQQSDKTPAQVAQEFNIFREVLTIYEIQRAIDPTLPQHTENNNANPQQHASVGSTPSIPVDTPTYIPASTPANTGTGTPQTVVAEVTLPTPVVPTGTVTPPAPGPIVVTVVVPPTPLPFVVTPATSSQISGPGGDHFGPVMSADGQYIVYDPDGSIFLYNQQTHTTITVAQAGGGWSYSGQTISADGHFVVYQGTNGTQSYVFIYNNDSSDLAHYGQTVQLVAGGAPTVSGDGSRIVVEHGGNSIGIYDQQGHVIAAITPAAIGETGAVWLPAVSADGHMIAFWQTDASSPGGSGQLFVYDLSTGIATAIASTNTDAGTSAASFSADGRYVVYQSDAPGGHSEIYLYDLSTGQVVFHTANASGASYHPVISPDGNYIIFASDAQLADDNNAVTDTYVVDVSNPANPVYTRVSNLDGGQPAAANLGASISAGGLYKTYASSAAPGTGDIFLADPTSGRSVIIQESANAPATLTAGGVIALTGDHNGATVSVVNPTGRFTVSFDTNGDIVWSFSEPKSDFAALLPGQSLTQNFEILLTNDSGTMRIPVRVVVYDADRPVAAVVVANPGTIAGDNGNNTLTGTLNNDILQGFGGDDTIIGLTGVDRAVYLDATGGITVDMAAGTVTGQGVGLDTLIGVEAIQGSNFVDHYSAALFTGNSGVPGVPLGFNSFEGMAGDDIITGNVNVQGQILTRISYASSTGSVSVDLASGVATGNASVGTDHFTNVNSVIGSGFADTLSGSENPFGTFEQFDGRAGNDTINGRGGYDMAVYNGDPATHSGIQVLLAAGTVTGDATVGTDTLRDVEAVRGTRFADTYDARNFGAAGFVNPLNNNVSTNNGSNASFNNFDGQGGNDAIYGNGNTRIQYSQSTAGVYVNLTYAGTGGTGVALDRLDALNNTQSDLASVGVDTIHGGVNAVMGSMFGDTLIGSSNNEFFQGLGGDDFIDGRGGFDTAQYNNMTFTTGGISVDMALGTVTGDPSSGTDTLRSIEGIQGTNFDDSYDASHFAQAGYLNSSLFNVGDNGTFNQFEGMDGDDQITGNGNTRAAYFNASAAVTVDLALGTGHGTEAGDLANVGMDHFLGGVNGAIGSAYNDTLLGSNNTAPGSIEQFDGRAGDDTIDGRGGFDQVTYANDPNVSAGITVHMAVDLHDDGPLASTVDGNVTVGHDILYSVESVIGTRFGDSYEALNFTGFNEFQGLGGDDQITGNEFTQLGYYNATSGVTADMLLGTADGDASVGHDTFTGVNEIRGSNFGDTFLGDGKSNILDGLGGNDTLDGRGGNDTLIGGLGADIFVYATGGGADTISDFRHSEGDRIDLTGVPTIHSLAELSMAQAGPDTIITFSSGDTLTLSGVSSTSLVAGDFVLASAPNEPPSISGGTTFAATEDTPLSINTLQVFDADAGSAPISVTLAVHHGMLAFTNATTPGLTGDFDGTDGTVSLTGSQSAINTALANGVVYTPESNYNGASDLTVTVDDLGHTGPGGPQSDTANFDINITAVNDAPTLDAAVLASVVEDVGNVANDPFFDGKNSPIPAGQSVGDLFGASFADVDAGSSLAGVAVIANHATPDQGVWQYMSTEHGYWENVGSASVTEALAFSVDTMLRFVPAFNYSGTPGSLEVRGLDNTFDPEDFTVGSDPGGGRYTIDTTVNGGSTPISGGAAVTLSTAVTPVNDAPALDAHGGSLSYTESQAPAAIDAALTLSDVDSATLVSATVQITGNFAPGQDVLGFTNQNGIQGSYDAGTGVLTLTGTASTANYQAALASVTYFNSSGDPSTVQRTVSFTVNDGGSVNSQSNTVTATVDVTPVNNPPTASNLSASGNEDASVIAVNFAGTDYDGGLATVEISSLPAHGHLYADAGLSVLLQPGDSITVAQFGPTTAYFVPDHDWSGSTTFSYFTVDNEGAQSASAATVTIDVTPVADAPVVDFSVDSDLFTVVPESGQTVANDTVANSQIAPTITALSGGGYVVVWQSVVGGNYDIVGQRFDAAGAPVGDEITVNNTTAGHQEGPVVTALADDGFVVAWNSSNDVFARRFDVSGPVGNEFEVNNPSPSSYEGEVSLATLSGGGFVATWTSDVGGTPDIVARLYDAAGAPVGSQFQVNEYDTNQQRFPVVRALANDHFLVAWNSDGQDGSGTGAYFRLFDSNGGSLTGDIQANSYTTQNQRYVDAAALDDGGFVVVWQSEGQLDSSADIYGQRYDASGVAVGDEFPINTDTANNQQFAAVIGLEGGGFVVSWLSDNQGIRARAFDGSGAPSGGEFRVDTSGATGAGVPLPQVALARLNDGSFVVTWHLGSFDGSDDGVAMRHYNIQPVIAEDTAGAIPISVTLTDLDGSESLTGLDLIALPVGAIVSDGVHSFTATAGHTTSDIVGWNLSSLTFQGPENASGTYSLTLRATVTDQAGAANDVQSFDTPVSITVVPVDDATTITGDHAGDVSEDGILTNASGMVVGFDSEAMHDGGTLTVHDPDNGQNHFQAVAPSALQGAYGNFSFNETTGAWTYELDHGLANSLAVGQTRHDTLTVTSADGAATEDIVVTVHGSNDAPVAVAVTGSAYEGGGTVTGSLTSYDSDPDQGETGSLHYAQSGTVAGFSINSSGFYSFNPGNAAYDYLAAGATTDVVAHYTVTDQHGEQSTSDITITLTGTNDAPVLSADDLEPAYVAGDAAVAIVDNFQASDVDSANYSGGSLTVAVTAGAQSGDTLSIAEDQYIDVHGGASGTYVSYDADGAGTAFGFVDIGQLSGSGSSLTVSLNSSATNAAIATLAEAIRFQTSNQDAVDRTVTFTLNDGDGTSNGGHNTGQTAATVHVAAPDAPVATSETLSGDLAGFTYYATNGHWYSLNDVAWDWAGAHLAASEVGGYLATITSSGENDFVANLISEYATAHGQLSSYAYVGGSDGGAEGVWLWVDGPEANQQFWQGGAAGSAPNGNYQNWQFDNIEHVQVEPNGGAGENYMYIRDTGEWVDYPGSGAPGLYSVIELSFAEDFVTTIPRGFLLANDTGNSALSINGLGPSNESTTATANGGTVELLGNGDIRYTPAANYHGTDSFTYTVRDANGVVSNVATATFDVASANDAPDFIGDDRMPTYTAGHTAVALLENVDVGDIDSASYDGGSLTATVTAGFHVGDNLSIAESQYIRVASGNIVQFDMDGDGSFEDFVSIGTVSGSGTSLTVTLNDNASELAIETLAEAIRFDTSDTTVEDRTVTFTLNDGDGIANGGHDFTRLEATVGIPFDETNNAPTVDIELPANHVLANSSPNDPGSHPTPTALQLPDLDISSDPAVTVEFWYNYSGAVYAMPVGFNYYNLLVLDVSAANDDARAIGFNVGSGGLYGVERSDLIGTWHHITAVFNNGDVTQSHLYIDGVEQTLTPILFGGDNGYDYLTDSPRIGGWNADSQFALDGRFDDVSIWHGARNAADIPADMISTITGAQPGLVAAYTFEDVSDGPGGVIDASGNGNDATLLTLTTAANVVVEGSPSHTPAINEDQARVFSAANHNGITVGDPDGDALSVTLTVQHGTVTLASLDNIDVTGGQDGTATVTIFGTADAINFALDGLIYQPDPDYNGTVSLIVDAYDGALQSTNVSIFVINPVNDAPVVDLDSSDPAGVATGYYLASLLNDGNAFPIALSPTVTDVDNATLTSAIVILTNGEFGDFFFVPGGGNSGTLGSGVGWYITGEAGNAGNPLAVNFYGSFSASDYADAIQQISFGTTSAATGERDIAVTVYDGVTSSSNVATAAINVQAAPPENQPPVLDLNADEPGSNAEVSLAPRAAYHPIFANATLSDSEDSIVSMTVTFAGFSGALTYGLGSSGNLSVEIVGGSFVFTTEDHASASDFLSALQTITIQSWQAQTYQFTLTVDDGTDTATATVDVTFEPQDGWFVWTGAQSHDWNESLNWNQHQVPSEFDTVYVEAGVAQTVDVLLGLSAQAVAELHVIFGTTLQMTGDGVQGHFNVTGALVNIGAIVLDSATFTLENGTAGGSRNLGQLTAGANSTLELHGLIDNASGAIAASDPTGHIVIDGATIVGGVLHGTGGGSIDVSAASGTDSVLDGSDIGGSPNDVTTGGHIRIAPDATLELRGTINNNGTFDVGVGATEGATLLIDGDVTLDGLGEGTVILGGHLGGESDQITGNSATDTLINVNNTISGQGQLGNALLTIVNQAQGWIMSTHPGETLWIDTGSGTLTNHGHIGVFGGTIDIAGDILNAQDGFLNANAGLLEIHGAVTSDDTGYFGSAIIVDGTLQLDGASELNVSFSGAQAGMLVINSSASFSGVVSDFSAGDTIDFATAGVASVSFQTIVGGLVISYDANNDAILESLTIVGSYDESDFSLHADGNGGVNVIYQEPLPVVIGDMAVLAVKGGGEVAITVTDLNVTDIDTSPDHLVFTVDDIQHGRLTFGNARTLLDEGDTFTLADIQAGNVYYQSVGNYVGQDQITLSLSDNVEGTTTATAIFSATIVDAQFIVLTTNGYDFEAEDPISAMGRGDVGSVVSDTFTISDTSSNREFIFTGSDFFFDGDNFIDGIITGILERDLTTHQDIASLSVSVTAHTWYAAVTAEAYGDQSLIEALTSQWTFNFIGNAGADSFITSDFNDIFTGRAGNDTFGGEDGYDRAYYGGATDGITVTLADGIVTGDASVGTDTLLSIEMVTGSNFADTFNAGATAANPGGFGANSTNAGSTVTANVAGLFNEFEGRGGDDTIIGNGQTRVSYYHATAGVSVTFNAGSWTSTTSGASGSATGDASVGTDTFLGGVNSVRGSNFVDHFQGSTNPSGSAENFEGMGGNDEIDGGGGFDRAVYQSASDNTGIYVDLAGGTVTGGASVGQDVLHSVEAIWGTDFADTYNAIGFSTSSANAGSTQTSATDSTPTNFNEFEGGGGDDQITGNGNTRVSYTHATGGVIITLGASGSGGAIGNDFVGHDHFLGINTSVTRARGSEFNDIITGNSAANTLEGQGGNDILDGQGANDVLTGGTGADIFVYAAGGGNDRITDFHRNEADRIDLRDVPGIYSLADVQGLATTSGANTVITFSLGNSITLQNISLGSLVASDFIFAGGPGFVSEMSSEGNLGVRSDHVVVDGTHGTAINPVSFHLQLNTAAPGTLTILANDVENAAQSGSGPSGELDNVYINGHLLGQLTQGVDGVDTTTSFSVDPSFLVSGDNLIAVQNVNSTGGWNFTVVSASYQSAANGFTSVVVPDDVTRQSGSTPAGDLGQWANWTSSNPATFTLALPATGTLGNVALTIHANDVELPGASDPGEIDQVFVNGHSVGFLTQAPDAQNSTTVLSVDSSFLLNGNNVVTIYSVNPDQPWNFQLDSVSFSGDVSTAAAATSSAVAVTVQSPDGYDFSTLYDDLAISFQETQTSTSTHIFAIGQGKAFELIAGDPLHPFTFDMDGYATGGTITEIIVLDHQGSDLTTQDHVLVNTNGWNLDAVTLFDAIRYYGTHGQDPTQLNAIFNAATYNIVGSPGAANNHSNPHDGADTFFGGAHADIFNGRPGPFGPMDPGSDTVDYSHAAATGGSTGITVSLAAPASNTGTAAGDIFISIENLRGSNFNDTLTGDGNNNVLEGGLGNDILNGSGGTNTASYEHAAGGVIVSLQNPGSAQDTQSAGIDTLYGIQNLRGSAFDDQLTGNGSSVLEGGDGDDTLTGTSGQSDTASYEHASAGVTVNLAAQGYAQDTHGAGVDTLTGIANLTGSQFNDILTGNSGNNILFGNGGHDTFVFNQTFGAIGHDTIGDFNSGADHISLDYEAFDASGPNDFAAWVSGGHVTASGGDVLIDLDLNGQDTILIRGMTVANLHANDFILPTGGGGFL